MAPGTVSALSMFSIGIGPSSSHTVGPMRAAGRFVGSLAAHDSLARVARVRAELYGSLAATGIGHGTDKAVLLGLEGEEAETVDTDTVEARTAAIRSRGSLRLGGGREIAFAEDDDLVLLRGRSLPGHPNGMRFQAFDAEGAPLLQQTYYSIGGGFVVDEDELAGGAAAADEVAVPFPYTTAAELVAHCESEGARVSDLVLANERACRPESETRAGLLRIWDAMQQCVSAGIGRTETVLPGGLRVQRRAPALLRALTEDDRPDDPIRAMDWVSLYALAVNEENASGGRVVTAPTNGAAGIVPAVLHYVDRFFDDVDDDLVVRFLLVAGAIGALIKRNASISGAEAGCQGEVGSACAMAAGALCEVMGGTARQVENAAEIGIEHNLGLTCDPVGGLVQIPCIERNAIASSKAINAARIAMRGDGSHLVSLDAAIATMRQTGADMKAKYKETSLGGLAVNVVEC